MYSGRLKPAWLKSSRSSFYSVCTLFSLSRPRDYCDSGRRQKYYVSFGKWQEIFTQNKAMPRVLHQTSLHVCWDTWSPCSGVWASKPSTKSLVTSRFVVPYRIQLLWRRVDASLATTFTPKGLLSFVVFQMSKIYLLPAEKRLQMFSVWLMSCGGVLGFLRPKYLQLDWKLCFYLKLKQL